MFPFFKHYLTLIEIIRSVNVRCYYNSVKAFVAPTHFSHDFILKMVKLHRLKTRKPEEEKNLII